MNIDRIKEIMDETAYPDSRTVATALSKVWNECQQENNKRIDELEWKLVAANSRLEIGQLQIIELENELSREKV